MATGDPGFNAKNIINIPLHESDPRILCQQISRLNGVENISATSTNLGRNASGTVMIRQRNGKDFINMDYYDVDQNFITNMRLQLIAGQSFAASVSGKESQVVISESARKILQFKTADEAVGQSIQLNDSITVRISGVIKDFYHRGLETPYVPLVLRNREEMFNYLHVKAINPKDKNLVAAIEKIWTGLHPNTPFEASWLYDDLRERKSAWSTVSMLGFLAIITITLACLGLLGMVVYHTETRKKEIGIRKVMGASVAAIMSLLSKNFMRLVIIAGLIALPLSYALSYFFLTMFANRINIGFGILVFCFVAMLLITLLTIGSHIYKVAIANPVNALRSE
jgi:putative ABC transport system permease protein